MALSEQDRQRQGNSTRVDITYRVKEGTEIKRIPFRAGVMANLTGHNEDLKPLYEREFTSVNQGNLDKVMGQLQPKLNLDVEDTLSDDKGARLGVELIFNNFADFHPSQLIKQIPRLWKLYQRRQKLEAAKRMLSKPAVADTATAAMKDLKGLK